MVEERRPEEQKKQKEGRPDEAKDQKKQEDVKNTFLIIKYHQLF